MKYRITLLVLLILAGVCAFAIKKANPKFQKTPAVAKIDASMRPLPKVSKQTEAFFTAKLATEEEWSFQLWKRALRKGLWPDHPQLQTKKYLPKKGSLADVLKARASFRASFLKVIHSKSCFPFDLKMNSKYKLMGAMRGIRYELTDIWWQMFYQDPAKAGERLLSLFQGLHSKLQSCPLNLLWSMVGIAMSKKIHSALGFAFAHPGVPLKTKHALLSALHKWEKNKYTGLQDTFRYELAFMLGALDAVGRGESSGQEWAMRKLPFLWSIKASQKMMTHMGKINIYRSSLDIASEKFWAELPEETYFKDFQARPKWLLFFTYNAVGKILLSVASPVFRKYILMWHQSRCLASAHRLRYARQLRDLKVDVPAHLLNTPALHPLTKKPIRLSKLACAFHHPKRPSEVLLRPAWIGLLPKTPNIPPKTSSPTPKTPDAPSKTPGPTPKTPAPTKNPNPPKR